MSGGDYRFSCHCRLQQAASLILTASTVFELDHQLSRATKEVGSLALSRVLFMNDSRYSLVGVGSPASRDSRSGQILILKIAISCLMKLSLPERSSGGCGTLIS